MKHTATLKLFYIAALISVATDSRADWERAFLVNQEEVGNTLTKVVYKCTYELMGGNYRFSINKTGYTGCPQMIYFDVENGAWKERM